jgi:hypothetical protein
MRTNALEEVMAVCKLKGRKSIGISRWTPTGASYRTVHRFFHTKIDWEAIQGSFFEKFCWDPKGVYLLAGEESVITKSGKCTFGLDRLFSSLFDKAVPGISCFSMALIHVGKRQAYSLATEPVARSEEESRRPRAENKHAKSLASTSEIGRQNRLCALARSSAVFGGDPGRILHPDVSGVLLAQGVRLSSQRGDRRQNPCRKRTCGITSISRRNFSKRPMF